MDIQTFGERAVATSTYFGAGTGSRFELYYLALGLAGESGELSNILRKILEDVNQSIRPNDRKMVEQNMPKILNELGDVFWFAVRLCHALGVEPEDVMEQCDSKLAKRFPEEFARLELAKFGSM